MIEQSIESIDWLQSVFEEPIDNFLAYHDYLWPYAALLCKIADVEGLELSDNIIQMLNFYPDGVDEPFAKDDASSEEKLNQWAKRCKRRKELISTIKFHIDEFERIAEEQGAYSYQGKGKKGKG